MMGRITPAMSDAAGRELARSVSYPIAASDVRRWALAVYHPEEPPREFWDETYAEASTYGGIVAPEDFNPFAWMTAEPSGIKPSYEAGGPTIEAKLGLDEIATDYMLNGGAETEYGKRMRPGDVIISTTVLDGYEEREGRLGMMLFTRSRVDWDNQRDEKVKTTVNTLIRY